MALTEKMETSFFVRGGDGHNAGEIRAKTEKVIFDDGKEVARQGIDSRVFPADEDIASRSEELIDLGAKQELLNIAAVVHTPERKTARENWKRARDAALEPPAV